MSNLIFPISLLLLSCFSLFSIAAPPLKGPKPGPGAKGGLKNPVGSDPNAIYKSFLECLPTQSPQPDPAFQTIVFSPAANASAYSKTLYDYLKNLRYNHTTTNKPVIIVTPTKESHVQATVLCAKKLAIQIKIRSGGHDYEAISYASKEKNFMILDMHNMRKVDINIPAQTAVVEAGAILGELYYRIWEKSKVHGFPSGVCPTIGVGGHISGGGYGTLIRKYGISCDHVTDAKIVTADGKVKDRKAMGEDLFWAIRGGGGSSFGVILQYTLKLVPVPPVTTIFQVERTAEQNAVDLIVKWQTLMPTADPDLFIRVLLDRSMVNNKPTIKATFVCNFLGDSTKLLGLLTKIFPELGIKKEDCHEVTWYQSLFFWYGYDYKTAKPEIFLDRHSSMLVSFTRKSDYVQTPIPKQGWIAISNKLMELDKVGLGFNPYGGKMSEIPANATAMPHRAGNLFKIQYSTTWEGTDPKVSETNVKQGQAIYEFMTGYVSKNPRGSFANYRDFDVGVNSGDGYKSGKVYGEKYFGVNFERLVKVKTAVDPENFFRNEQSIPTHGLKSKAMVI